MRPIRGRESAVIILVDPKYTCQECSLCGYTKRTVWTGTHFIVFIVEKKLHADVNVARVILKRHLTPDGYCAVDLAEGRQFLGGGAGEATKHGCTVLAARSWLHGPGCTVLAARRTGSFAVAVGAPKGGTDQAPCLTVYHH